MLSFRTCISINGFVITITQILFQFKVLKFVSVKLVRADIGVPGEKNMFTIKKSTDVSEECTASFLRAEV